MLKFSTGLRRTYKLLVYAALITGLINQFNTLSVLADAQPLPQSELQAINNYPNWVATTGSACSGSESDNVPAGSLATFIPEPYNGAFTQGANAHNVAPALVAALFSEEHNLGGSETAPNTSSLPDAWSSFVAGHPDPNSGWDSSSAGAQGPFQFEPATWTGLGYNISDINNLVIASDAAAKYAQSDGATKDKPESTWKNFIYSYNHADWYVTAVLAYYDYYNAQASATAGGGTTASPVTTTPTTGGCAASSTSPDCTSATGVSLILCDAQQYNGIYYKWGGGHTSYSAFRQACPLSSLSSAASTSSSGDPGPCGTDCSGLVSMALDQAFGDDYQQSVASDGTMQGSGSQYWVAEPVSQAHSGDIVTLADDTGHVEIVDHITSGTVYTFGSHHTGAQTGQISAPISYWQAAYRWAGPTGS